MINEQNVTYEEASVDWVDESGIIHFNRVNRDRRAIKGTGQLFVYGSNLYIFYMARDGSWNVQNIETMHIIPRNEQLRSTNTRTFIEGGHICTLYLSSERESGQVTWNVISRYFEDRKPREIHPSICGYKIYLLLNSPFTPIRWAEPMNRVTKDGITHVYFYAHQPNVLNIDLSLINDIQYDKIMVTGQSDTIYVYDPYTGNAETYTFTGSRKVRAKFAAENVIIAWCVSNIYNSIYTVMINTVDGTRYDMGMR